MSDLDMDELSPSTKAFLDDVRELDGPTPGDRDRVKRALVATLASGAGLAASTAASSTAAATTTAAATSSAVGGISLGVKIAAVALVAAAVGGTALVVAPSDPEPAPRRAPTHAVVAHPAPEILRPPAARLPEPAVEVEAAVPAPVEEAVEAPAPEAVAPPEPAPVPRARRAPATPREIAVADSTLSEELVLLREAQRAIQADRPAAALGYLDDHARRFPSGVLEEEREAARVLALCRADRADEARALATRFLRERPSSPHRARVRSACP